MWKGFKKISTSLIIVSMLFALLGYQTFANEDGGNLEDDTVSQEYDESETGIGNTSEEVINEIDNNEIICSHVHDENCGGLDSEENCNHIHNEDCYMKVIQETQNVRATIGNVFQTWGPSTMGDNITAELIQNSNDTQPTYTLKLSGTGNIKAFNVGSQPWIKFPLNDYNKYITKIEINEGITSLSSQLFLGLYNVTGNINLPSSLTKITDLQDVFGNTGASVGGFILTFSDYPPYNTFRTLDFDYVTQNKKINLKGAFRIPEGIKYIGTDTQNGFMRGYPNISSVVFPSTIETIYSQSFMDCSNITQVLFPGSLASGNSGISVDDRSFLNTNIRILVLPDTITKIGSTAFGNTNGSSPNNPLKTVYFNVNDDIAVAGLNGQAGSLPFSGLQFNSAVIICKNESSYHNWRSRSNVNPRVIYDSLTYELDLKFCDPTTGEPISTIDSQRKLYNKSIQYEKDYGGEALLWDKELSYQLPEIPSQYKGATGWSSTPGGQEIKNDEVVLWDKLYPTPIKNEIFVTPKEMVSYIGGTSLSGNDFPNILFDAIDSDNNKFEINNYTVIFDNEADNKSLSEYLDSLYGFYLIEEDGSVAVDSSHGSGSETDKKYVIKPLNTNLIDIKVRDTGGNEAIISVVYVDQGDTPSLLTVRPTLSQSENTVIQSMATLPSTPVNQPTVQLRTNVKYTDSAGSTLTDLSTITLISSSFLDPDNESTVINNAINTNMSGYTTSKIRLALADNANGNIYTTVSEGNVTLIFPYPEGSSKEDDFVILHFPESSDLTNPFDYVASDIFKSADGSITKIDAGLKIEIDNFSPFVVGFRHKSTLEERTPVFITEAPNTGDSTNLALIFGIFLISLSGIVIVLTKMKKDKER